MENVKATIYRHHCILLLTVLGPVKARRHPLPCQKRKTRRMSCLTEVLRGEEEEEEVVTEVLGAPKTLLRAHLRGSIEVIEKRGGGFLQVVAIEALGR